jgi:hypothetical protein
MDAPSTNLLHDRDLAAWADRQAEVLRRLGRSRGEEWPELDWVNLAEEMESLGRTEVKLVTSPLKLLFVHMLKAVSDPSATSMPHRKTEAVGWLSPGSGGAPASALQPRSRNMGAVCGQVCRMAVPSRSTSCWTRPSASNRPAST